MNELEILTVGRVSVDLYPQQTGVPLERVTSFGRSLGGTATNVAVAAARLGRRSAVLTKVGAEPFGTYVRVALGELGVDPRFVGTDPELRTPVVFCALDPPEDPPLLFYREPKAPDMNLVPGDLDPGVLASVPVFWVTGTGLSDEPSASTTMGWLAARDRSRATVLDLDYRPMFWRSSDDAGAALRAALELVSIAVGNRTEAEVAVGTSDPAKAAAAIMDLGVELVLIKLGSDGVYVATRHLAAEIPPVEVAVMCALGAGDAFGGALCHGIRSGWDPVRSAQFANAAGAIVASRLACADAMPSEAEVRALLATAGSEAVETRDG
jgi:5-dehydro-2-deoxygluconokinase